MDDIIDLTKLENLPDPALINILSRMDPESLINVCDQSKRIRTFCETAWKRLFKRDVTSVDLCDEPLNWGKLYRMAMSTRLPLYIISINYKNNKSDLLAIGRTLAIQFIDNYLKANRVSVGERKIMSIDIKNMRAGDRSFTKGFHFGSVEIAKNDDEILVRDVLIQMAKKSKEDEKIPLYWYKIETKDNSDRYPKRILQHEVYIRSRNYILGQESVFWRLKRILVDDHGMQDILADIIIDSNKDKLMNDGTIDIPSPLFSVRIHISKVGTLNIRSINKLGIILCDKVEA